MTLDSFSYLHTDGIAIFDPGLEFLRRNIKRMSESSETWSSAD